MLRRAGNAGTGTHACQTPICSPISWLPRGRAWFTGAPGKWRRRIADFLQLGHLLHCTSSSKAIIYAQNLINIYRLSYTHMHT